MTEEELKKIKLLLLDNINNPNQIKISLRRGEGITDPELLKFLINEGIFHHYISLYDRTNDTFVLILFLFLLIHVNVYCPEFRFFISPILLFALYAIGDDVYNSSPKQMTLFTKLSMIKELNKREFFLKLAISIHRSNSKLPPSPDFIKGNVQTRWLNLLQYITESSHSQAPFYSTVSDLLSKNIFQNNLGFTKLHHFNFFAKQTGLPKEIYCYINKIMADLLALDSCKSKWKPL